MEVTTVSSSPASPTEGDDLCETDVTNVAIHIVTLLICLCGLLGNAAVLCLLSLKGGNAAIFALAFADFLFLLFTVPSSLLSLVEDVSCSHIMPQLYLSFLFQLSVFSYYWALFRLMYPSNVDYTDELFILCCHCEPPLRLRWLLYNVQYWSFFALFAVIPAVTNLCPSDQQEHCRAALISIYTVILLFFAAPMVTFHTVDFICAKWGSKEQQFKRRDIIFFLILLVVLLLSFCNILQLLGYTIVSSQIFFLLNCIHSSMKPFIYFLAGRCWRPCSLESLQRSLQRVFDEQKEEKAGPSNDALMDTVV
ncbi:mas-related G-protein coupled receptor member X1-like [Chamaea fasciata]|uniref:mas-related G-protein coupled receptor member X1-like n=1 Tax=Chamaea fasciata TaxID=190680 RepID=UPI00336AD96F